MSELSLARHVGQEIRLTKAFWSYLEDVSGGTITIGLTEISFTPTIQRRDQQWRFAKLAREVGESGVDLTKIKI